MGGASARQLQSHCKMYSCFCKSMKMYIQLRVPTYNHNKFVLHCCWGFSASARNDVNARASSWLVNAAQISAKVQIFQLARIARKKRSIRAIHAASFTRIAPQDCLSRLCIDLTCKSFARFASFASGVNAPLVHSLWSSPKFLNRFCLTILTRLRFSRLVVHIFLSHFFLPLNFLLTCFDTALCEQPASLAMNSFCLPSLWRVSMILDNCQISSLSHDCVSQWTTLRDHFEGSGNLCRCFKLISWLACHPILICWDSKLVGFC